MINANAEVRRMKLSELRPSDYNPRKITDEAFSGLGHSIERFGMLSHIVWNERSGNIVGGHQRYKQLLEMGEVETDVVVVDLDDDREAALNITLNNKEVRGKFTKEVMDQLRMSEAQLGSAFKEIGLLDMYEFLCSQGFDKKKRETQKTGSGGDGGGGITPNSEEDGKPQAVITCPQCKSQWKMSNGEVVFNNVTGVGSPVAKR